MQRSIRAVGTTAALNGSPVVTGALGRVAVAPRPAPLVSSNGPTLVDLIGRGIDERTR